MVTKISNTLLVISLLASLYLIQWGISSWATIPEGIALTAASEALYRDHAVFSAVALGVFLLAYLLSFSARRPRRPWLLILPAAFVAGATTALPVRAAFSAHNFVPNEWPELDSMTYLLLAGCGLVPVLLITLFEWINRVAWSGLASSFDQKGLASPALACNRVALLFRPGQEGMLLSVTLARFRRGARGEVVESLRSFHENGEPNSEVLEALCKAANEEGDSQAYLKYLRELFTLHADDEELREILVEELVAQGHHGEALGHMRAGGVPKDEDGLERYITALIHQGHVDEAVGVIPKLAEVEGIPFRRSQALLREVLSRTPNSVKALNLLANQAERMALREQMLRWLEKSLEADPHQRDVRRRLINTYREIGQGARLEKLLEEMVADDPRDSVTEFEYIQVLHANSKTGKALERLRILNKSDRTTAASHLLEAEILFEQDELDGSRTAAEQALRLNPPVDERKSVEKILRKVEEAIYTSEVVQILEESRENPEDLKLQLQALQMLIDGDHTSKIIPLVDQILAHHPGAKQEVAERLSVYKEKVDVPFPVINLLGDLQVMSGQLDEALEVVKIMAERSLDKVNAARKAADKILSRSPNHLPTLRYLAETYRTNGRFTDMIHTYTLYLGHGGEQTREINQAMANAYLALNDFSSARPYVAHLFTENPRDIELLERIIPVAMEASHAQDASEYLKLLELADPRNKQIKKWKLQIDKAMGEERFVYLKQELETGKGGPETLEQLGDLATSMENHSEAITCYQRASRDPEDKARARRCTAKLARAYLKKRLDDLCADTLRNIQLSLNDPPAELAILMEILYDIGDIFLEFKLYDKAEHVFKQLCKIDAGYRDVLDKVEKLNK
ncbi:MAG: tetratricopeptide repeat protein [Candidatus Sumerlaeia bacterium]|nr:tetratricopeptide repeat protein [Candidatus Sumerlaeia bacterium]